MLTHPASPKSHSSQAETIKLLSAGQQLDYTGAYYNTKCLTDIFLAFFGGAGLLSISGEKQTKKTPQPQV